MKIRIATWNINSVRLRVPLVKKFCQKFNPDILCLQEIKCTDDQFPLSAMRKIGFEHVQVRGQKAYHGVATLSRLPISRSDVLDFNGTDEARHLAVQVEGTGDTPFVLHNVYVPAGGDEPDVEKNPKFGQKLDYLQGMTKHFKNKRNKSKNRMMLVGDLNVAPLETDVWSHKQLLKVVSHTPVEVDHFTKAQTAHNWIDAVREHIPPEEKLYTWWSYRARDWRASNRGRRLDHVWVTPTLGDVVKKIQIIDDARDWEKPSDHIPVIADIDLSEG